MSLRTRPNRGSSPPPWLVFLVGVALVFGIYYVWVGLRNFFQTSGLGVIEATERAVIISTATAERVQQVETLRPSPRPTTTPVPACQDFEVTAPSAIVREQPSTHAAIVTSFRQGTIVCVVDHLPDSEWYVIDANPATRRFDQAYMHESIIRAMNPTLTPSKTFTPLPSVTALPSLTPSSTSWPTPSATRDPRITDTPTPTLTPTATQPLENV